MDRQVTRRGRLRRKPTAMTDGVPVEIQGSINGCMTGGLERHNYENNHEIITRMPITPGLLQRTSRVLFHVYNSVNGRLYAG